MADEWGEFAATWDEQPGVNEYADGAAGSLSKECEALGFPLAGTRVLDFGCGTGLLTERMRSKVKEIVALDLSAPMIAKLQEKVQKGGWDNVTAVAAEATPALFQGEGPLANPFDLVVASSALSFVPDYPAMAALLAKQLRPGGILIHWDWEKVPPAPGEEASNHGLSREEVKAALSQAGLEVLKVDTGFTGMMGEKEMKPIMGLGKRPL